MSDAATHIQSGPSPALPAVAADGPAPALVAPRVRVWPAVIVLALMWGAAAGLTKFAAQGALKSNPLTATQMEDALWRAIATD